MKTIELIKLINQLKQGNHLSSNELKILKTELDFLLICTNFRITEEGEQKC